MRSLPETEALDLLEYVLTRGIAIGRAGGPSIRVRRRDIIVAAAIQWAVARELVPEVPLAPPGSPPGRKRRARRPRRRRPAARRPRRPRA